MAAGHELAEHQTEGVDVACSCDLAAGGLLGCHVGGRALARPITAHGRRGLGEPEVGDAKDAAFVDHDVGGLQVTVHDTLLVGGGNAGAELARQPRRLSGFEPAAPAQEPRQVLAGDPLHGQEVASVGLADVPDPTDVRVRDLARDSDLVEQTLEPVGVLTQLRRQELERDDLVELEVMGAVDLTHPAAPGETLDAVPI